MVVVYLLVCNKKKINLVQFTLSLTFNRFVSELYLLPVNIRTALFVSLVFV